MLYLKRQTKKRKEENLLDFTSILLSLFAFAVIIMVHEFGHFLFAKLLGFRVEEFAIGFGKKLFSKKYGETVYSIRAVPLGGFNAIPEIDSMGGNITPALYAKRFVVLVAGGLFNIISAVMAIFVTFWIIGFPVPSSTVQSVQPDHPAYNILMPNDKILSINGHEVVNNNDLAIVKEFKDVSLVVERGGQTVELQIHKNLDAPLGAVMQPEYRSLSFSESFVATGMMLDRFFMAIDSFWGTMSNSTVQDKVTSLSGPIGVTQAMVQTQNSLGISGLIVLAAFISIQIGIFNLLPVPLLDGGRIMVDTIQLLTRNALNDNCIKYISYSGLVVIGLIFLCGMGSDIFRIIQS